MLLHHVFGEVNGRPGVWGHAVGGMGAITQAMARAAGEHGVRIDVGKPVREVIVEGNRASGIVLDDGTALRARAVIANVNPQSLLSDLVPPCVCQPERGAHEALEGRIGHVPYEPRVVATAGFFGAARRRRSSHLRHHPGAEPCLHGSRLSRLRTRGWSRAPIVEMVIPSTLDDSLAPPGAHVASLFCQHVAPEFCAGSAVDEHREKLADLMIDTVEAYAPGFKSSVVARQILSPADLSASSACPAATFSTAH